MLPHLLEILLVGQEAIQLYYLPVQMILIFNGSPLVFNNGEQNYLVRAAAQKQLVSLSPLALVSPC